MKSRDVSSTTISCAWVSSFACSAPSNVACARLTRSVNVSFRQWPQPLLAFRYLNV
jgi:hypothetical protein